MSPNGRKTQKAEKSAKETIHSGHFMVSDIDDSEAQDGDESPSLVVHESDCDQESSPLPVRAYDFETACKETSKTYTFGPRSSLSISIDVSLTKLFECMTLAYSGKLTSPRWKQFKGLKLRLKEKIRLNNMIWRAWHMQFVMKVKPFVCQFASPLDGEVHTKPEAVVIEGTYWKRRMANITAEYKKWRLFYKDHYKLKPSPDSENMAVDYDSRWSQRSVDSFTGSVDEDFIMDFSDTLFSTLNPSQPFDFPNPREIAARAGIADFIQPGLVQLQPSVDDFMDTLEPFQDFLNSKLPTLPEETSENNQLTDLSSSVVQEVNLYDNVPESSVFSSPSPTFSTTSPSKRGSDLKRKTHVTAKPDQHAKLGASDKLMVDNFLNISSNSSMLSQNSASETVRVSQSALQLNTVPCNVNILVQSADPANSSRTASLPAQLQNCSAGNQKNMFLSGSLLNSNSGHQALKEQGSGHVFQQESLRTDVLGQATLNIMQKQPQLFQATPPSQVPLTTLASQASINPVVTQTSSQMKTQNVPLFLAVDLVTQNQVLKPAENGLRTIDSPASIHSVFSSTVPLIQQQQQISEPVKKERVQCDMLTSLKSAVKSNEAQVFRRHSYATGQQVQPTLQQPIETLSSVRSRRIAPAVATTTVGNFAVPEVPSRHRTRSRSVSSPQGGSPKQFSQQPSQAVSLTDISASIASQLPANRIERTLTPDISLSKSSPSADAAAAANVLPQNALLAQLLSGRTQCDFGSDSFKSSSSVIPPSTSSVTLIESLPALVTSSAQTFVFSTVPLTTVCSAAYHVCHSQQTSSARSGFSGLISDTTSNSYRSRSHPKVAGVSDFQRNLLVGAANQAFGGQNVTTTTCVQVIPGPLPSNPGSPSCSPSAVAGGSFDSNQTLLPKTTRLKSDEERNQYKEHRRVCHINAEQKRRCNIKNGFEALHHLLPPMNQNPNAKVSKAALLQRGAEYIRTLKAERQQQQEEAEHLKKQIEALNQAISHYQSQLPASGVPVPCQKTNRMKEMFEEYVRQQTLKNWKFWIFSLIIEPLVESYNNNVSTANIDEMCKSILAWLDQHCSLVALRPGVLNSLRHLSTTTNILTDPSCIAEEATRAVTKKETRPQ